MMKTGDKEQEIWSRKSGAGNLEQGASWRQHSGTGQEKKDSESVVEAFNP